MVLVRVVHFTSYVIAESLRELALQDVHVQNSLSTSSVLLRLLNNLALQSQVRSHFLLHLLDLLEVGLELVLELPVTSSKGARTPPRVKPSPSGSRTGAELNRLGLVVNLL